MSKFNVGDKVIGNEMADYRYAVTVTGWIGVVTKVDEEYISVRECDRQSTLYVVESSYFDLYEPAQKETCTPKENIEVVCNGRTVTATYKKGSEVILSAKAKCHPEDKFDFLIGAKIATERLVEKIEENKQPTELYLADTYYGTIGKETPYHDFSGEPLFVGDIVNLKVFDKEGRLIDFGKTFVVFYKRPFIMGAEGDCRKDGTIKNLDGLKWFIEKITDHSKVKKHTIYNTIEAR